MEEAVLAVTVGTLNLASGRGRHGVPLDRRALGAALGPLADLPVDVLCLQEVDVGQPRSHHLDQARVAAQAIGATSWRFAPTLAGTPSPWRTWTRAIPQLLGDGIQAGVPPLFGNALLSRSVVRRWHVLGLTGSRARLPVRAPDPRYGSESWWWIPDEPRVAIAAELDGVTVVSAHLSFWPPAALRQLLRLQSWLRSLPAPVVVAGDLNLPGAVPTAVLRGHRLVRSPTYPAAGPRVQLDHVIGLGGLGALSSGVRRLDVGDHLAAWARLAL
ncbi:MAG: endonuclease/exonuclease/phosphatase family protein [Actinomycetes bacterium]